MAVVHLIPGSAECRTPDTHPISVCFTPTVQRDYLRRGVFPHIRLGSAVECLSSGAAIFWTTATEARALLDDALAAPQRAGQSPKGTPKAFGSLSSSLRAVLDAEACIGLWVDPGLATHAARTAECYARFNVGDSARYSSDWDGHEDEGVLVEIVGEQRVRGITGAGSFVRSDGARFDYAPCYTVKALEGERTGQVFATFPRNLLDVDFGISHMRLVK